MNEVRREKLERVLMKRQFDLTVVMENVNDPHNIAAVMRTCDAVGIQEIYVLNSMIRPPKKFGAKSSSSASKWLSVHHFSELELCVKSIREKYKKIYTTFLTEGSLNLYEMNLTEPIALVFGNEHDGVSDAFRQLADGNFMIPQVGIIQSLNISVACAVTIYEAYRQKTLAGHYEVGRSNSQSGYSDTANAWGLT
jgi:tRNA (guanosine-2'-O-)-methyltransferase